jgi:Zn-dependent protease
MNLDIMEVLAKLGIFFVPFLFALSFHEFAHGWMAKKRGDNTAELMGRLTLNPFAHADPLGTFALPIIAIVTQWPVFGWAKPVPVNERNLKDPKNDMFLVAIAGPASNLLLAILGAILFISIARFVEINSTTIAILEMLKFFMAINLILCLFNLIPLHPLDGGKVLARFIPYEWNRFLEERQSVLQIALIVFFVSGGFRYLAQPVFRILGIVLDFAAK